MNFFLNSTFHDIHQALTASRVRFAGYFLLLALVLGHTVHYGFTGDESGYTVINTAEIAQHPSFPFFKNNDTGHPVVYTWPVAILWHSFGRHNTVANVSIWIAAALALAAVHRLAQYILKRALGPAAPRWAGPAAALALFSTPLFISNAEQYLDPIPYVALLLWMVLAWVKGKRAKVALLGGLLALVRITGCLSVLGLGLFDLAYGWTVRRRRGWRAAWSALAPYLASAVPLAAYLFIKLAILKRPLSNISANAARLAGWAKIRVNIMHVLSGIYGTPRWSFSILLAVAAAALLWSRLQKRRRPPAPESGAGRFGAPEAALPGAAAIYGAIVAAMLPPTLFYCVYRLYPQPRWLIPWHALIAIAGVHGLIVLLRGRLRYVAPLLGLWCALQIARWHNHWVDRCFAAATPETRATWRISPSLSLDLAYRKRLNHEAVGWVMKNTHKPVLFCAYPTGSVFENPVVGYIKSGRRVVGLNWLMRQPQSEAIFDKLSSWGGGLYFVRTSWDMREETKFMRAVMSRHSFRKVYQRKAPSGEEFTIYKFARPASAQ